MPESPAGRRLRIVGNAADMPAIVPLFSLQKEDGRCFCGAASIFAVYPSRAEAEIVAAEFAREYPEHYRFTWTDAWGAGLDVAALHSHLPKPKGSNP